MMLRMYSSGWGGGGGGGGEGEWCCIVLPAIHASVSARSQP